MREHVPTLGGREVRGVNGLLGEWWSDAPLGGGANPSWASIFKPEGG